MTSNLPHLYLRRNVHQKHDTVLNHSNHFAFLRRRRSLPIGKNYGEQKKIQIRRSKKVGTKTPKKAFENFFKFFLRAEKLPFLCSSEKLSPI